MLIDTMRSLYFVGPESVIPAAKIMAVVDCAREVFQNSFSLDNFEDSRRDVSSDHR